MLVDCYEAISSIERNQFFRTVNCDKTATDNISLEIESFSFIKERMSSPEMSSRGYESFLAS